MREWIVEQKHGGRRMDQYLRDMLPGAPESLRQKFLRLKRIKLNGKPAKKEAVVQAGDSVAAYVGDECFLAPDKGPDPLLSRFRPHLEIAYEDQDYLVVNKRPGMLVHPDDREKVNTLITHVSAYLYQKGEPGEIALCNRIDRFTGGLVAAAKTREALRAFQQGPVEKGYVLIAHGALRPLSGAFDNYIVKGAKKVAVSDAPAEDGQRAITLYRTLAFAEGLSLVECILKTGRTHQIRAQFAHVRHPVLGDQQYGDKDDLRRYGRAQQALWANRLVLPGGQEITVRAPFIDDFFPDWRE